MTLSPELPYDRLLEMEDFIRGRTHGDKACENAVKACMAAAHAEAVRRGDSKIAFSLLIEAVDVVWNLRYALAPTALAPDPYHGSLWLHSDRFPHPTKGAAWSIEQWVPDQSDVEGVAADYLKQRWMSHGHLDWCLVDALTRREIVGYEAAVMVGVPKAWTSGWVFQKLFSAWLPLLIEFGIAAGALAWLHAEFASPEESPYRWGWAFAVGAYYTWVAMRMPAWLRSRRVRQKVLSETAERVKTMHRCYAELSAPLLDPTRVRDALLAAEKLEVRWSRVTWPLLEAAIGRDPHRWLTTPT